MSSHPPLIYNGMPIADKGEAISLTDMWKAHGGDVQKAPAKWRALPSAKAFIEHVQFTIGKSDSDLIQTVNGGKRPGTWAHWQIAMAYAKYLSPEFQMWCNQVVRDHMEGKTALAISDEIVELLRRTDGIARMLSHKVTGIEKALNDLAIADGLTAGEVCDLAKVAVTYPRGLSGRVSRRLGAYCRRMNETPRIQRLGRVRAQLFPAHLVREWLDLEGRSLIKAWVTERQAQGRLKLVPRE